MRKYIYVLVAILSISISACNKDEGVNIFTIDQDKELGLQVKQEIASDPIKYPILSRTTYASAYAYLDQMKNTILSSNKVTYRSNFLWELSIIHDDNIQNAFCTPGGYIYVYTGLIKYLDNATSLAGVIGHEIAHADKRHTTEAMTKQYGISTLVSVILGDNQNQLTDIAQSLVGLTFSRENETEADKYSVNYLCPSYYRANGAAEFFTKIINQGGGNIPEFLSTHPNPDNRVNAINMEAVSLSCTGGNITTAEDVSNYNAFKAMLP
ncbi:MAG: M48 family metalloprotease [Chitinophagaceae bacterium]|nr:M48 family metalloprotease [Chitinophagaceae bacterium]